MDKYRGMAVRDDWMKGLMAKGKGRGEREDNTVGRAAKRSQARRGRGWARGTIFCRFVDVQMCGRTSGERERRRAGKSRGILRMRGAEGFCVCEGQRDSAYARGKGKTENEVRKGKFVAGGGGRRSVCVPQRRRAPLLCESAAPICTASVKGVTAPPSGNCETPKPTPVQAPLAPLREVEIPLSPWCVSKMRGSACDCLAPAPAVQMLNSTRART
eukprot:787063-Pleurochrysis_carterae.AAC.1